MPHVDLSFRITGNEIPVDHGYALYAALSHTLDAVHQDMEAKERLGIFPIRGALSGERMLRLVPDISRLTVRLDSAVIPAMLPLSGKTLRINGAPISIGIPEVRALVPTQTLNSRLVIIKGFMDPAPFLQAARRQLDALEIKGQLSLINREGAQPFEGNSERSAGVGKPLRRTMRIRDKEVVGFAVQVSELSTEESICLQKNGLGGRRKMGCGLFMGA